MIGFVFSGTVSCTRYTPNTWPEVISIREVCAGSLVREAQKPRWSVLEMGEPHPAFRKLGVGLGGTFFRVPCLSERHLLVEVRPAK